MSAVHVPRRKGPRGRGERHKRERGGGMRAASMMSRWAAHARFDAQVRSCHVRRANPFPPSSVHLPASLVDWLDPPAASPGRWRSIRTALNPGISSHRKRSSSELAGKRVFRLLPHFRAAQVTSVGVQWPFPRSPVAPVVPCGRVRCQRSGRCKKRGAHRRWRWRIPGPQLAFA